MWVLPTMSRPKQCQEVLDSLVKTGISTPGVVFVNGHSHKSEYEKLRTPKGWEIIIHPDNLGALGALNWCFNNYAPQPFYGYIADDEFSCTPGWDSRLTESSGKWNVSHGNDGWQSEKRIHGHVCIGGDLARAVGYLAIPRCWHWYGFDSMWEAIATPLGIRKYLSNVKIEHRHPNNKNIENTVRDECYEKGEAHKKEDAFMYQQWMDTELPGILARVQEGMAK